MRNFGDLVAAAQLHFDFALCTVKKDSVNRRTTILCDNANGPDNPSFSIYLRNTVDQLCGYSSSLVDG